MENKAIHKEPKYRKPLNEDQVLVLKLLYKFRFGTAEHIATRFGKPTSKSVQKRLKILEDQGFISKHYDKTYKLQGKPAVYYLTPAGARAIQLLGKRMADEPVNVKRIYRDKVASEGFMTHLLHTFTMYNQLRAIHGEKIAIFSRTEINYEKFDYFIQPLPDSYIRLTLSNATEKDFFIEIFEETEPYFVLLRRVKRYVEYSATGIWEADTDSEMPHILLVCANKSVQKRLRKRIVRELNESYEVLTFATALLADILNAQALKGKVWLPVTAYADNLDEPVRLVRMDFIS